MVCVRARPAPGGEGGAWSERVGERRRGGLPGLGTLVENAVDFARERVEVAARWSQRQVIIEITDDGHGVPADVMDALGDPYITTRPARPRGPTKDGEPTGLGLGFFIAKTLLERSGATVARENAPRPALGAMERASWPRRVFESKQQGPTPTRPGSASTPEAGRGSAEEAGINRGVH